MDPEENVVDQAYYVATRLFRPVVIATIYAITLPVFGAPIYKAAVVAALAFVAILLQLGSRVTQMIAVALVGYALAWWLGALPGPEAVRAFLQRLTA